MMNEQDIFEMCECGHFGGSSPRIYNMHNSQTYKGKVVAIGHGDCKCNTPEHIDNNLCSCDKFVWIKFCDKEGNEIDDNIMRGRMQKKEVERQFELIRTRQQQHKNGEISSELEE